ncbi:hypothetical protein HPG69_014106 [Diceros bicornis minor]|uniref:Uncharacterized protein n=1 Tax=Diceros bicornis minor TaxID=77932 RepID=A0A7J7EN96_DICBM|nr:hypothetical protein HPG69_014106 [Diceros bicornis minor]
MPPGASWESLRSLKGSPWGPPRPPEGPAGHGCGQRSERRFAVMPEAKPGGFPVPAPSFRGDAALMSEWGLGAPLLGNGVLVCIEIRGSCLYAAQKAPEKKDAAKPAPKEAPPKEAPAEAPKEAPPEDQSPTAEEPTGIFLKKPDSVSVVNGEAV